MSLKNDSRKSMWLALFLSGLTFASFFFLTSKPTSADSTTSASVSVNVAAACTFDAMEGAPHTATIPAGTYQPEIGYTLFTITCNDTEGYGVYAIGYSNQEFGNNKLLANINGSSNSTYDINTGINTSGSPSSWAMKLTPLTELTESNILNGYNNYSNVPSQYTKVVTLAPATNSNYNTSVFMASYAVNIAGTQPAGNYNGKVKYTMVHPSSAVPNQPYDCDANKICYFPNGNGSVTDTMGDQSITASATSATLWASNFKRDGYGFVGWSDKYDWVVNANDASGNGTGANEGYHIYGPNQDITFTAGQYSGTNKGLSLYAVWVKSQGPIQDWNGCSVMNVGEVTALTDKRDNDTYAVAKLADGKCWMIENLRLDNTNSDNSTGNLAQGYAKSATYGNFEGLAKPEIANFSSSSSAATFNSLYYFNTQEGTASIDISNTSYPYYRMPRFNNNNTNQTATTDNPNTTVSNMTGTDQNIYSYGNYYTWAAAIADTSYYNTNNQSVTTTSLCPKDWRLPQGGDKTRIESNDDNDFWNLVVDGLNNGTLPANYSSHTQPYYINNSNTEGTDASNKLRAYPNNILYSGNYYGSSAYYRGSYGYYWSSTAYRIHYSYDLYLKSTNVYPGTYGSYNKYYSQSIRCLAQ